MTEPATGPHDCTSCGSSIDDCDDKLHADKIPCCGQCALTDTHGDTPSTYGQRLAARGIAIEVDAGETPPAGVDGDGVKTEPGTEVEPSDGGLQAALMAAAEAGEAAGALSTIPAATEFAQLCQMARMLSLSEIAPKKLRDKPYDTLLILLTARDLQIPVTSALRKVSIIEGQPSIDTELQLALVRQRGFGAILPLAENFTQSPLRFACAVAVGPNGQPIGPPTIFTWEDAQMAGYVDGACLPEAHDRRRVTKGSGQNARTVENSCACKDNWRTVPRDMLWWRAAARARRIYFPEATTGMYDADELGGVIDVEGHLVDPTTAPLPDGFEDPKEQRAAQQKAQDAAGDPAELWGLQERIRALPSTIRAEMREAWKSNDRIQGRPPWALPERLVKLAKSMLNGWEAKAKQADNTWDRDEARAQVREEIAYMIFCELIPALWAPARPAAEEPAEPAPEPAAQEPQEPSEPAPGPEVAPGPSEPQEDAAGPGSGDVEPEPETDEPDRDWSGELKQASAELTRLTKEAPPFVAGTIDQDIRGMSWQAVNKALESEGLSTEGPIDLRRMRLAIRRLMQHEEPF
jgi:hypothetical protein